jgi:FkbM family methyltransferase
MSFAFTKRIQERGLSGALSYYFEALAWRVSPNYKQNPKKYRAMSLGKRIALIARDSLLSLADFFAQTIDRFMNARAELSPSSLQEFEIRLVDASLLSADSVIYAFGVARHIETEELLAERLGATVYLFDPTPPALEFMEKRTPNPHLVFDPIGVWISSGPIKFFMDRRATAKNLSVVNMYHTDEYVEALCLTLPDIMSRHHHDRIDVLKMDIEGSALPVLIHMFEQTNLRPTQIVGALERPLIVFGTSLKETFTYIRDKAKLMRLLRKEGYRVVTHHAAEFTAIRVAPEAS